MAPEKESIIDNSSTSRGGSATNDRSAKQVKTWVSYAIVVLCIIAPASAVAFSLAEFFGSTAEAASSFAFPMPNSKTPALQYARNIDPNPAKGGGDIIVVNGALVPESGPEGTLADIQGKKADPNQISIYVVRSDDTLSAIGKLFGVSANTILWANNLKSSKDIHPGDTLVILPVTGVRYTVVKGDTLPKIAKKFGGDADEIAVFNGIQGALAVGTEIIIPDGAEAPAPSSSSGAPTSRIIASAGGPLISGYFMRPLIGGIKTQGIHGYNGIDIGTPVGTQIMASASGTVIVARDSGWNGGYGDYVVIQHPNGTQTVYGHLSRVYVSSGANVVQGQVIGLSGVTGKATGPHLHFEIRGAANPF